MCYEIEIVPRDVMYFRDARPIGASADGAGANWPLPSTLHSAFMSAFHHQLLDQSDEWESSHQHLTAHEERNYKKDKTKFKFGGMKTWGPFPKEAGNNLIYLPTPADLLPSDNENRTLGTMQPIKLEGGSNNLPSPLKYAVASTVKPTKKVIGSWMSVVEFQKYLAGKTNGLITKSNEDFYQAESRPGIAINAETGTTKTGAFYSAEYLRLKPEVSFVAFAEAEAKKYSESKGQDLFKAFFSEGNQSSFIFGGQRGVAWLENHRDSHSKSPLEIESTTKSKFVKWVLISPAYFESGWKPYFIDSEGRVQLKESIERGEMTRKDWRTKLQNSATIGAKLVAARVPKAIATSGWKLGKDSNGAGGNAKATKLLVPAGTVYYFECDTEDEAEKLVKSLHGQTKSGSLGEQGFGLGLCGTWELKTI